MLRDRPSLLVLVAGPLLATACAAPGDGGAPRDRALHPAGAAPSGPPPTAVASMLAEVSAANLRTIVDRLAGFGTRHTLSDTDSDSRGIGAARRWIRDELERYAAESGREGDERMRVRLDEHLQPADGRRVSRDTAIVNVVAELPGSMPEARARLYYVIGHYDSRASDPMDSEIDAPGANDDASGVALVMELARVMSKRRFDATLVFMPTAGEEQGLYGAALHARAARDAGADVRGVLSNDIVGDPTSPSGSVHRDRVRVFSEAIPAAAGEDDLARIRRLAAELDSPSRQLARYIAEVSALHRTEVRPMVIFRTDRFLRGGDHTAFNREGYAAVRFSEVEENYDRQHQDVRVENGVQYGDLPEFVDEAYLAGVTRLNGAALAHLANAPSTPADVRILVARLENETTLRWSPSPEPDVAGYEVVWRETTAALWQTAEDVGEVTEATLAHSKDNHFFGVRAYDRDGYRSPVAFAGAARE